MLRFALIRLLQTIPVLLAVTLLTFTMTRAAPGGPFSQERHVSPFILEQINVHYGLNEPLHLQFLNYIGNAIQGDLGPSYRHEGRSVDGIIREAFPVSLELGLWAFIIAIGIGIPAGIFAAVHRNSALDYGAMSLAMAGICLPTFVMGPLLILVFGLWLGWFNVIGWSSPLDRVLPAITLGLYFGAYIARLTRSGMLEMLSQDFIRTARAKGVSGVALVLRHALRGGIQPVIAFMGPAFAALISGSFVVESIFGIPGLGRHFVNAAFNRDYTMVMGTVLFYATLLVLLNLVVDIVQVLLNPRLKYDS